MTTYKLNPQALNDKWGGVICLELGSSKPSNFGEILAILKDIVDNHRHYLISVIDIDNPNVVYGDYEQISKEINGAYAITQTLTFGDGRHRVVRYWFYEDGRYGKSYQDLNAYLEFPSIKQRITELENKLNEITQTE